MSICLLQRAALRTATLIAPGWPTQTRPNCGLSIRLTRGGRNNGCGSVNYRTPGNDKIGEMVGIGQFRRVVAMDRDPYAVQTGLINQLSGGADVFRIRVYRVDLQFRSSSQFDRETTVATGQVQAISLADIGLPQNLPAAATYLERSPGVTPGAD